MAHRTCSSQLIGSNIALGSDTGTVRGARTNSSRSRPSSSARRRIWSTSCRRMLATRRPGTATLAIAARQIQSILPAGRVTAIEGTNDRASNISGMFSDLSVVCELIPIFSSVSLLYRLLQKTITRPGDFAVSLPPWFHDIQIYSFAFNLWFADTRALDERMANPRVLDVGWTEFDAPTDSDDLKAVSTTHLTVEEERYLGNPGRTRAVSRTVVTNLAESELSIRPSQILRKLCLEVRSRHCSRTCSLRNRGMTPVRRKYCLYMTRRRPWLSSVLSE